MASSMVFLHCIRHQNGAEGSAIITPGDFTRLKRAAEI
jgi:hypothetical protein